MSDVEQRRLALYRRIADLADAMAEAVEESGLTEDESQLKISPGDFRDEAARLRKGEPPA